MRSDDTAAHASHGHEHSDGPAHDHGSHPDHDHRHDEHGNGGPLAVLRRIPLFHAHAHTAPSADDSLTSSERGIRAVKISLVILGATSALQVAVFAASGSVALLADTVHNLTDALTALPLWLAFVLGRRPASRRFTYGHGRLEDLAGVFVVLVIAATAVFAGYESVRRMLDPAEVQHLGWVVLAALVGFAGNEVVAVLRIRVGKEIGSAALVADGQHARVDGLTSLAVLLGALGVWLGFEAADPIVGGVITLAILFIVKDSAGLVWRRLMDAVEPEVLEPIEAAAAAFVSEQADVYGVQGLRLRWLGHDLHAEMNLQVDESLSTGESHRLAEELRHALYHANARLTSIAVHVDPWSEAEPNHHELTDHHGPARPEAGGR